MRDLLTVLAGLLVVVLTAALAGPYFVDWTTQRVFLEQRISAAIGARVGIEGPVSLRLLPTPSLDVGRLTVDSEQGGGPSLHSDRAEFELAIAPLMRGELQVVKADLERPVLSLRAAADGSIDLPGAPASLPRQIAFESLSLRDGTLRLETAGRPPRLLQHIDMTARADSLAGPFAGAGVAHRPSGDLRFSFEAGSRDGSGFPFQAALASDARKASLNLNGALRLSDKGPSTAIAYSGAADAEGVLRAFRDVPGVPWSVAGNLRVDPAGVALDKGLVRIGPDKGVVEAHATAKAEFTADSPIVVSLRSDQIDADRLFANLVPNPGGAAGAALLRDARNAVFADADLFGDDLFGETPARAARVSLAAPLMILGGQTVSNMSLDLDLSRGAPAHAALEADMPGDADLSWNGTLAPGVAARAAGKIDVALRDPARFATWIAPSFPSLASNLRALPARSLAARGTVSASSAGWRADDLVLTVAGNALDGAASYASSTADRRASLDVNLTSNALDIGSLPDLGRLRTATAGMDVAFGLDARAVRLGRLGSGEADAGKISLRLHASPGDLRIDNLTISDVGGADLGASGEVTDRRAVVDATLDATRLTALADMLRHAAPGAIATALGARADALSPARLSVHAEAERKSGDVYLPTKASLNGKAAGVDIVASAAPNAAGGSDVSVDMSGSESTTLMRQLGFGSLPIGGSGPGRIHVSGALAGDGALKGSASASLAGVSMTFEGSGTAWATAPEAEGALTVHTADAAPFLNMTTLTAIDPSVALPLSLSAHAVVRAGSLALTSLAGAVADDPVTGSLTVSDDGVAAPRLGGDLAFDRLDLRQLVQMILGPTTPAPGAWAKTAFAPGLANLPAGELGFHAARFDLAPNWIGERAQFRLTLAPGEIALRNLSMGIGAGSASGSLDLRRNANSISATAGVELKNVTFAQPYFAGKLSGSANFATTGTSEIELARGLAGSGSMRADDFRLEHASPDALPHVLAADRSFDADADETIPIEDQLVQALDAGPFTSPTRRFDLGTAGGRFALNAVLDANAASQAASDPSSISIDLRSLAVESRLDLQTRPPKDWPDTSPPRISLLWRAPAPGAPAKRLVRADALEANLAARAASREAARIEDMNQDIRERAFFERRLKGLQFMHRREAEVAAWKAEQRRKRAAAHPPQAAAVDGAAAAASPDPLSSGRF